MEEVDVSHGGLDPRGTLVGQARSAGRFAEAKLQDEADHADDEAEEEAVEGTLRRKVNGRTLPLKSGASFPES